MARFRRKDIRLPSSWGLRLLAVWVILMGLTQLLGLHFSGQALVVGALGVAAGVMLLVGF